MDKLVKPKAKTLRYYDLWEILKYIETKYQIQDGADSLISWLCCTLEPREDSTYEFLQRGWLKKDYWGSKPKGTDLEMLQVIFKEFGKDQDYVQIYHNWQ